MKKIVILTVLTTLFFTYKNSLFIAQAATSGQATPGAIINQQEIEKIQKIKELVASRVAELNLVEKRGIIGAVKDSTNTQVTIEDNKQERRIIDIDELTKFQSSQKSFGISDIKTGDIIAALGLYNKETKRLLARFITVKKSLPVQFEGIVLTKDNKNYKLTAVNESGDKKTIDIQSSTKTLVYTKDDGITKSGFSKIREQERIILSGYQDLKDINIIIADRLIRFPEIPLSTPLKLQFNLYSKTAGATSSAD